MKAYIAIFSIAAALFLSAAYTRPHEPAGKYLHETILPGIRAAMPECPRVPFSGLLQLNGYQHRPTGQELEVMPAENTPYSSEELSEIYKNY